MSLLPKDLEGRRNLALVVVGVLAALALRIPFFPFESVDYLVHQSGWYALIAENGYSALREDSFFNNVPYLYLLTAMAVLLSGQHPLLANKAVAIPFDFALAYFVYKCVGLKYRDSKTPVPILAGLATLLAPTVVLHSSAWSQSCVIYLTFLVACLYFLLAGRQAVALIAFGLAVSFKPQAVLLAPLFLWLVVKGQLRWRHFAWVPLVYLATAVPAVLVGRPWGDLLLIYFRQFREKTWNGKLTQNFANLYTWIPNSYHDWWPLGVVFAGCVALLVAVVVYRSTAKITAELTVFLAAFSTLVMPYTLPKMHDRYYFPAEIFAIVLAFYLPRYWYVPVGVLVVSTCLYVRFLAKELVVPHELLALIPSALVVALSWQLYRRLRANPG